MLIIPYLEGVSGFSSILTFAIVILFSFNSSESSSKIGEICLQGPHHSAQKSHNTKFLFLSTCSSKLLSFNI